MVHRIRRNCFIRIFPTRFLYIINFKFFDLSKGMPKFY